MVNRICPTCKKEFSQKGHLDKHLKRVRPCKPYTTVKTAEPLINEVVSTTKKSKSRIADLVKHETKPLSWYSDNFPELYTFVTRKLHPEIEQGTKEICVMADVKSGKRYIVIIHAIYTTPIDPNHVQEGQRIVHVFISSWVRQADDNQRAELNTYLRGTSHDPRVFKINSARSRKSCISKLQDLVQHYDKVIVHHDELDFGSGSEQHMAAVYEYCISQDKIISIRYSASPEEAIIVPLSVNPSKVPKIMKFQVPSNYRGAKWYLENNLVYDAEPFFTISNDGIPSVSNTAKELLNRAKARVLSDDPIEQQKKLIIVRQNSEFEQISEYVKQKKFLSYVIMMVLWSGQNLFIQKIISIP